MNKIILALFFGYLVLVAVACSKSDSTTPEPEVFTLNYDLPVAVVPDAEQISYIFFSDSSSNVITRSVSGGGICGSAEANLSSADVAMLKNRIASANLLNQTDVIDGDCVGASNTSYDYFEGSLNHSFSINACGTSEPEEVRTLRETLDSLAETYFANATLIPCPN